MVLQAIRYERGSLLVLDQLQLPYTTHFDSVRTATEGWHAIKSMRTRGAPAIAIVAALSLAVELTHETLSTIPEEVAAFIIEKLEYLVTSRPTAVNLADAARKLEAIVEEAKSAEGATGESVRDAYVAAAERMLEDDVKDNRGIGDYGAKWILEHTEAAQSGPVSILTHCNTGSLATAGYGTALGVIRSLHEKGALKQAFCTETRPYNQGSRLTAYELVHDAIPATLVTDSMAAALMRLKGPADKLVAVVVGADRVAANGDTANKIGTYALSILAKHHGIKFLVAAPRTTIDLQTPNGEHITIEERASSEVATIKGPRVLGRELEKDKIETIAIAAQGIDIWNPAFDVTPAELIDGIITEVGVAEKDANGRFNLSELFNSGLP
ncbi:S-methyl-5-thioribose-1-phosphate isomerase [Verruconis gallopava]|uniref:Methylthioribose-1-phosphate isomerase n=1 Tax=Verruconis gallopava TaxID=253628 RepID=A0A0D1YRE4_9PEZI|nr:S-methyl-5-thioribose-1-phosphate isomerase [Verruconis gallopava]KIW03172.1 S-methyl-5-thioribose-1-phosphate isomerase [Verruconis gallopava]